MSQASAFDATPDTSSGFGSVSPVTAIELVRVTKRFGAVLAVHEVDLGLTGGRVHALVGENGAGKSTLVNILGGVHQPDDGTIVIDGRERTFASPTASRAAGIAVIHQEPALFPHLSVAENVVVGRYPLRRGGRIDRRRMRATATEMLARLGAEIDLDAPASTLSIAEQQILEIARALSQEARTLVMDEPTASLTGHEVDRLVELVHQLRSQGAAILYITHRLEEIARLADDVTVLRDGAVAANGPASDFDETRIIRDMVGRRIETLYPKTTRDPGRELLRVEGLRRRGVFGEVSVTVREGEVLGMAGLVGAGRTEVARAIFGLDRAEAGAIWVDGQPLSLGDVGRSMAAGLAYVPEDRRRHGLVMTFGIASNISLANLAAVTRRTVVRHQDERHLALRFLESLSIKATGPDQVVASLSGGNQQKVVLSKWIARTPKVLILDEPTRGIDIATKAQVYTLIGELVASGLAVILISSDLPEVLAMSDRILVMAKGDVMAVFDARDATPEAVMTAATGQAA